MQKTTHHLPAKHWRNYHNFYRRHIPPTARSWLLEPGSLTQRIKLLCGKRKFSVQVLQQHYRYANLQESQVLAVRAGQRVLVREVHLCCNGQPWLYARTLVPVTSFSGRLQRLKHHGSRSLGAALFADRSMRRGKLQIISIIANTIPIDLPGKKSQVLWGRRSVFYLQNKPLLVAEYFLPALYEQNGGDHHE